MLGFDVHFLRPWWFLALLPAVWLLWKAWQVKAKQGAWHQVIAPQFRELLLSSPQNQSMLGQRMFLTGLALIWLMMSIILAGPSLKSVEIPAQKSQQGTVIVLDLSLSMLADDLSPNRLAQVKYKLTDLLTQHPELPVGMVAYAGSAHTITPISEDNQTLLGLLPTLNPLIMPHYGSNPIAGFEQAKKLLDGAHVTQGQIIWITDDIETSQIEPVKNWFAGNDYQLNIMTVGTPTGAAINVPEHGLLRDDKDQLIIAHLPAQRFAEISQALQAPIRSLQVQDQDINWLVPEFFNATDKEQQKQEKNVVHPLDEGAALLLVLVPLIALLYRRGVLFSLLLMPLFLIGLSTPNPAQAEDQLDDLANMFQSHDQQGYKAFQRDNFQSAEALFEDKQWQASSLYRLRRYQEAARLFEQDHSAKGHYNRGNALAFSGDLQGAQKAYHQALKLEPKMKTAQDNLALIEKLLDQQMQQQAQQKSQQANSQPENSGQEQQGSDNAQGDKPEQESSDSGQQTPEQQEQNQQDANSDSAEQSGEGEQDGQGEQSNANQSNQQSVDGKESQEGQQAGSQQQGAQQSDGQSGESGSGQQNEQDLSDPADGQSKDKQQASAAQQGENDDEKSASENEQTAGASRIMDDENSDGIGAKNWEEQQATEAWLQQIPDQPGLFLQRKFDYQYQLNKPSQKKSEKTW
ncbi:VWA domain-containing protein [Thiomicrorhabdus sp. 6S2-11]|uniref:VWA domain-containing protein n=1 Tax=Thiomicrorhabdus marina TaxID=2818442 RepID=A0ABS3Q790_9GAMM|nr:VWA domain-containing protein [Thiomicrorhabdus marina]MBO1928197.1 VWA domain-containing protein [Thiomicrorhabdus marina]